MSPSTLNVAVLHHQVEQREALCDFVADEVGFRMVGGSGSGPDALALMRDSLVHVLVLDLASLPEGARDWLASARAVSPGTGILLLVQGETPAQIDDLMLRGATGYVASDRVAAELTAALRTIGMGRRYLPSH